jgi:hypothetical protein
VRQPAILDDFARDSALLGLDACAGHNNAGIDTRTIVAQAQIATVQLVRPDPLGFRRHPEKVAAALSVASGAVPLRTCEGPLLADTVEKVENRTTAKISQMLIFGRLRRWDAP